MTDRHLPRAAAATAIAAVLALSGCSAPSYQAETAAELRGDVHAIAASSAAGDWAAAVAGLDEMADRLERAHSNGRLDDDRFQAIAAAMTLVRKDLEVAILAAQSEAERQELLDAQATLEERLRELTEQQQSAGGGDDGSSGGGGGGGSDSGGSGDSGGPGSKDSNPGKGKGNDKGNGKGPKGGRG